MLKVKFNEMIARHAKLPPIKNIVEDLMMKSPFFIDSVDGAVRKLNLHALMFSGSILSYHFTFYYFFVLFRARR